MRSRAGRKEWKQGRSCKISTIIVDKKENNTTECQAWGGG
jgi:hypothetical protein